MITSENLVWDGPHQVGEGVQRIYQFKNGNGLSVVNAKMLHSYSYAWEIAVISGIRKNIFGCIVFNRLRYDTPLTSDVEVFMTDEDTNNFIKKAANYFGVD